MKKGTTKAVPKPNGKGTNNNGIVREKTAKIINLIFGTPLEKIPIKKEAENENL